jgi:3-deoxy-manno-octulosonate cytidylyltransferase (CMP-KDO synthetase)
MSAPAKYYGIIPARFQSERFPGKPLADILGRPMFWHVYHRARQCAKLSQVVLATDDQRIMSAARSLEVPALLTRPDHPSGTDRVLEAAQQLKVPPDAVVVNIQGDEPALVPAMLSQLLEPFADEHVQVTTLVRRIDGTEAGNPNRVKVVIAADGRALYFSRAPIPYHGADQQSGYWAHIGLYAFRMAVLQTFVTLRPSPLEKIEKLEQLRLLEHDIPIHVVPTEHLSFGVDRPEDIAAVCELLKQTEGNPQ